MVRPSLAALTALLLSGTALAQDGAITATSPDGRIGVRAFADEFGQPRYAVTLDGDEVIEPSRLGIRFSTHEAFEDGMTLSEASRTRRDETWEQPWGERRYVRDAHEEVVVRVADAEDEDRAYDVRFRVSDHGVGFRYEVPDLGGEVRISDEKTEFAVPAEDATVFSIPAREWNRYEYLYETAPLSEREVDTVHTPVTIRLGSGAHVAIHEAALVDYSGMALRLKRGNVFEADLAPWAEGHKVEKEGAFTTPWRVVQVSDDAPGLIDGADIYLNLNEPNALGDVSWVEPGKYLGIWWGMHVRTQTWGSGPLHGATTENAKEIIDFAAEHGFDGVLIEGWNVGWDGDWYSAGERMDFTTTYPDFDIEEVTAYGAERGVRLIGHHETVGNVANYEAQMEEAYDLYERLGVRQVKTGYVADAGDLVRRTEDGEKRYEYHDGQFSARHHLRAVKAAAERKISLNPHEPIKDTGLRRTYPNWISREGARGAEYDAWGEPTNTPEHVPMLAFTRMLSGPFDYTPGVFDLIPAKTNETREVTSPLPEGARVQTTLAKQLALYVVIYSPIQMAADLTQNYEARPDAFQFIKDVPTDWEDSVAVMGEVGDYVVIARQERGGEDVFLGAVTDEEGRTLDVPLSFLEPGRTYEAQVYRDGEGAHWESAPYEMEIESREVTADGSLRLPLAPGGGAAVRFKAL